MQVNLTGEYLEDLVTQRGIACHILFEMIKIYDAVDFHALNFAPRLNYVQTLSVNCYKAIKILYVIVNASLTKNAATAHYAVAAFHFDTFPEERDD